MKSVGPVKRAANRLNQLTRWHGEDHPDVQAARRDLDAARVTEATRQLAELVADGDQVPAVDLVSWAQGYCAGYDARDSTTMPAWMFKLAEQLAELDHTKLAEVGEGVRARRIAGELADGAARSRRVYGVDGWPSMTFPPDTPAP